MFTINAGSLRSSGVSADGGFQLVAGLFAGGTAAMGTAYADGASASGGTGTNARNGIVLAGSARSGGPAVDTFASVEIVAVRLYDHQLTTAELAALRTFCQQRYGTP